MADKKKAMVTAGVIGVGAIVLFLLMRGRNAPRSVDGEYIPAGAGPEYLTYNIPMPSMPGSGFQPAPIIFGDISTGGGNSGGGCCNTCGPKTGNASGFGGSTQRAQISMPEMPSYANTYTPPAMVESKANKSCDVKEVAKQLQQISALIGIPMQDIYDYSLRVETDKRGKLLEGGAGRHAGLVSFQWFDPYTNRRDKAVSDSGKFDSRSGIRYTLDMACKCAEGYHGFCGQYLTPDLFEAFS